MYAVCTQAQLKEMYTQIVYKDHKIVELNNRLMEQDQVIIDARELVSEKDEVIRGRDMAIQLLQSTIAQQSTKLRDQESLITRLSAKVERAEIELNAFHEQLESDTGGEEKKVFAAQLKTIQENFAELLTKKENEMVDLRQQMAKYEETLACSEAAVGVNAELGTAAVLALNQLRHDQVEASVASSDTLLWTTRLQELEAEVEQLKESLQNKEDKLASSNEQVHSLKSELQQLRNTVASSSENSLSEQQRLHNNIASYSDISVYSTCSDKSVELHESRALYEEETCLVNESVVWKKHVDIPVTDTEKQTDRRVCIVRPKQSCVLEITAKELQRNREYIDDAYRETEEGEASQLTEAEELQKLNEELLSLHSTMEAKEAELEMLREAVSAASDGLAKKEEECGELTESVAGLSESLAGLKQQLGESEFLCEELRKELTESRDQTGAKDAELAKLLEEISTGREQLAKKEERCKELVDLLEECRCVGMETKSLLDASEQEVLRLNELVLTLQTSQSRLESSVVELQGKLEDESRKSSQRVENLSTEVAEEKKLNEEVNSVLAEKSTRLEELSQECDLLRETVSWYLNIEQELTAQIKTLTEDRAKDLEKFSADLDLVRAETSEKHERLEVTLQALSEKETGITASQSEVQSLTETIYQLQTSLQNKADENELLRSEGLRSDQQLESMAHTLSEKETAIAYSAREIQSLSEAVSHLRNREQEIELLRCGSVEKDGQLQGLVQALTERDLNIAGNLREIESLTETVSQLRTSTQSKDEEIDRLRDQISASHRALNEKEEELTASVASWNEAERVLRQQFTESQLSCDEMRTELAKCRDEIEANSVELGQLRDDVSLSRRELAKKEESCKELPSLLEESRRLIVEKENLVEKSVQEVNALRRQYEETESLLAEKTTRFEELVQEHEILQETVEKYKDTGRQLMAENETLSAGRENDLLKFNTDLDLLRTEIAEKDRRLEGMIQALSEEHEKSAGSLKEIESLKETTSQLEHSVLNKNDEIEKQKCILDEQEVKIEEQNLEIKSCNKKLEELEMMKIEYVNELSVQEDVIRSLRDELAQSVSSCEQLRSELAEGKDHVVDTEAELEQLRASVLTSRDELTGKEDACNELRRLLEDTRSLGVEKDRLLALKTSEFEVLSQECDLLRDSVNKYQNNEQWLMAQIQTTLESKENELRKVNDELDLTRAKTSAKQQEIEDMLHALTEKDAIIAETVREVHSSSETMSNLQMSLQRKDQEIELLKAAALEKDQQLEGLVQALSDKDANIAENLREIESLTKTVSELQMSLRSKDEQIEQLQFHIQEREAKIAEQDSLVESCYQKLEEHEVMKNEFVNQLSIQEGVITSLREELAGSSSRLDDTQRRLQLSEMEMTGKDAKISELSDVVASESGSVLREQLAKSELLCEELRNNLAEAKGQIAEKEMEMEKLQGLISASHVELAKKEEDREEMAKSATSLNESSVFLKERLSESELACEELRNELTKSRLEIETKEMESEKLRDEISVSRDELAKKDERCKELLDLLERSKSLIDEKDNLLGKYMQEVEELRSQNEDTNSLLAEKTTQFDELSQECRLLQDAVERFKSTEQELTSQVEVLEGGKESDLEQFNADLQLLRNELLERGQQLEDVERQTEVLQKEMSGKNVENFQLIESVTSLKQSGDLLREQLAQSELSCEELRNELARGREQTEARNAELETLHDTISAGGVELAAKEEECKELSQLLKNSRGELVELESSRAEFITAKDQIETKEVEIEKLQGEVSTTHADLSRKEEECKELTESVASMNESVGVLTQQLAESRRSCDELRNELTKHQDHIEAPDADRVCQEISTSCDHSAAVLEASRDLRAEKEKLLEASSLEVPVPDRLTDIESSQEYVYSNEEIASHAYDVVECVRPRYKITLQQTNLGDSNLAECMKSWTQFSDMLSKISAELDQTKSLTQQHLTVELEERPLTTSREEYDSSQQDDSTTSILPLSTLTSMAENVQTIHHCIEHHRCKTLTEFSEDIHGLHTQLSEQCRILEEQNQELEAARLEIETNSIRFEKLKSKSIAKVKEVSQKHQAAVERKDEELSELRRTLQEQALQIDGLTAKLDAGNRDLVDAEDRCLSAHNRLEELETLLADKNAQIVAVLEQLDGKEIMASVSNTSVESSVSPAVVENSLGEEMPTTGNNSETSRLFLAGNAEDDVDRRTSTTETVADDLRSILVNTSHILVDLLSVDDSGPSQSTCCENNLSSVQLYAERCREMIRDLQTSFKLKETELLTVMEELEQKKVLANKYGIAAKKLKQQLEQTKKDSAEMSDELKRCKEEIVELTAQVSALQEQHSQTEGELNRLQQSVDVVNENQQESVDHAETDELKEVSAKLEAELVLRMKEIEELKSEVDERRRMEMSLNKDKEDLSELLRVKDEQVRQLAAEGEERSAKLAETELLVRQKDTELSELAAEAQVNVTKLIEVQQLLSQKDAELSKLAAEGEERSAKLAETELLVRQKDTELSELAAEAQVNATKLMELQEQLTQKDEELSEIAAVADASSAQLVHLEQTIETQTAQLDSMSIANQELKNLLHFNDQETGEMMESHSTTMQQLMNQLSRAQDRLEKKTLELGQVVAENRELMQRIDEKDDEIRRCGDNIAALKRESEDLESELVKQREELKRNSDELAKLSSVHDSDLRTLEESQEQVDALQKELNDKCAVEMESHRKSCEMEAKLLSVCEELNHERSVSENRRSEYEVLAGVVGERDTQLNSLCDELRSMDDKVRNYEILISDLEQQLKEASARQSRLESELAESVVYQQQLAEAETALEQKDKELAVLETNYTELTAQLDTTGAVLDNAVTDVKTEKVESRDGNVMLMEASVQTCDSVYTADEISALQAQNLELTELNSQLSAEITNVRNRLADLEVENCTLRNTSLKVDAFSVDSSTSSVNTAHGGEAYQHGGDGSVDENIEFTACQLAEVNPVEVSCVTGLVQGNPDGLELRSSDELMSLKEKYSLLESSHARLKEDLLTERQNSSRFMSIERLKEGLEAENEKNVAQIEVLTATKQKMLAKLKQLKASNDSLVGQVEDLEQQLEMKSAELSNIPRMESEIKKLAGCLAVLEDEKRNWLSVEEGYKVAASSLREELASVERKREDVVKKLGELLAAADAEKCSLEQQVSSVRDELRSKVADYESRLTTLEMEKITLATSLEQEKNDFSGREEVLRRQLAGLQTLHDAVLSDTESYQQLLEQHTADNARLEEMLRTRSANVEELHGEIKTLRLELSVSENQKEELEKKFLGLVERVDSTETELRNMEQIKSDLDSMRNENAALLEEIDGLNWKVQGLSEVEQELTELQAEMFEVQSENGMLKKRLSFVEKQAVERSGSDESWSHQLEQLSEEKQKLVVQVEHLESQVNVLRGELNARPCTVECKDDEVEERSRSLESELEKLREHCYLLEDENARFRNQLEEQGVVVEAEMTHYPGDDDVEKTAEMEVEELRQRYVLVENENTRLQSVVEGMKSDNELLHQKVVACLAGSPRSWSTRAAHRQHGSEQASLHTYQQQVNLSFYRSRRWYRSRVSKALIHVCDSVRTIKPKRLKIKSPNLAQG